MNYRKILRVRNLTESVFVIGFERGIETFLPGQHVNIGLPGDEDRPYSLYNGIDEDSFEILVKEVKNGNVSKKLKKLQPGDIIAVGEPKGYFTIHQEFSQGKETYLICTGTGISPFHSYVKSYPELNYRLIHGISSVSESYERNTYTNDRYFTCTSRDSSGNFIGRITSFLEKANLNMTASYFICGAYDMIDQVFDILISKGVIGGQIKSEGYF